MEHDGRRYGATLSTSVGGRVLHVYAEELGGTDVISANLYLTGAGEQLRPCEMPAAKVLAFLGLWSGPTGDRGETLGTT